MNRDHFNKSEQKLGVHVVGLETGKPRSTHFTGSFSGQPAKQV